MGKKSPIEQEQKVIDDRGGGKIMKKLERHKQAIIIRQTHWTSFCPYQKESSIRGLN